MTPVMGVAIYIILWWLSFFSLLPVGAQSPYEAGEAVEAGNDAGAPKAPKLWKKAVWALGIAAILWLGVYWAVASDLFKVVH